MPIPPDPSREVAIYRFLGGLSGNIRRARPRAKALHVAVRDIAQFFDSTGAAIAVLRPGLERAEILAMTPAYSGLLDLERVADAILSRQPELPRAVLVGHVPRFDRPWGALVVEQGALPFDRVAGPFLSRIASSIASSLDELDTQRVLESREWINNRLLEHLPPKYLIYHVLDRLRPFTQYDHSAAMMLFDPASGEMSLTAERIVWSKTKSNRIGLQRKVSSETLRLLLANGVLGFHRAPEGWRAWDDAATTPIMELLDFSDPESPAPAEQAILCAPLKTRDGVLGILKLSSLKAGCFGYDDAHALGEFCSYAARAIQSAIHTDLLIRRNLEVERRHAMAELAKSLAHDLNNAFGSVLPLAQQLNIDVQSGPLVVETIRADVSQLCRGLEACSHIFAGMVSIARGPSGERRQADLARAVETTLGLLWDGLSRQHIRVRDEIPDELPPLHGAQENLERLLLNLFTNAREAMPRGGELSITAKRSDGHLHVTVADTGIGIAPENLSRVFTPFFTTKHQGTGIGLCICRALVWEMNGTIRLQSEPDRGTSVLLDFSLFPDEAAAVDP